MDKIFEISEKLRQVVEDVNKLTALSVKFIAIACDGGEFVEIDKTMIRKIGRWRQVGCVVIGEILEAPKHSDVRGYLVEMISGAVVISLKCRTSPELPTTDAKRLYNALASVGDGVQVCLEPGPDKFAPRILVSGVEMTLPLDDLSPTTLLWAMRQLTFSEYCIYRQLVSRDGDDFWANHVWWLGDDEDDDGGERVEV